MKIKGFAIRLHNLKQFKGTPIEELEKIAENLIEEKCNPYYMVCPVCKNRFNLKKEERKDIIYGRLPN